MKHIIAAVAIAALSGCGYNTIQSQDEAVSATHAQVLSVYKKRADLIPNLTEIVKGYAAHERGVFVDVAEARSKVSQVTLPKDATPEQIAAFSASQRELGQSLGRLIAVAEKYPELKADKNFLALQKQMEEVETQATAARNRYIRSIQAYNGTVRQFPTNLTAMVFGYKVKTQPTFEQK